MLQGLTVVELATHIAGPAAAGMLGEWGAKVTKIESLSGDPIRWQRMAATGESSPNFEFDNRGKRSLALDTSTPDGREIVRQLARGADVFITSLRPGPLKRAGLDYETLRGDNPKLVYGSVTGYGLSGPGADMAAFDITAFWARSGLARQFTPPTQSPSGWRPGFGDHVAALSLTMGILAALTARSMTGAGRLVEASLLRSGIYVGGFDIADFLRRGETVPSVSRENAVSSYHYRTSDDRWICVWAHNPAIDWPNIFAAAGRAQMAADPRFASPEARLANGKAMVAALDQGFGEQPLSAIAARLDELNIIWSPLQTLQEVAADEIVLASGAIADVDDGAGGVFRAPAAPVRFSDYDPGTLAPPPRLGQHTDAVLTELGYGTEKIAKLRAAGIINAD